MEDKQKLLRHFLAALAYRTQKALRGAPADFGSFRVVDGIRTPSQLVCHMTSVLGYARRSSWAAHTGRMPYHHWRTRSFGSTTCCMILRITSRPVLSCARVTAERLLQGPFSDAMTHAGQLAMLRRLAGFPVSPENFIVADIDSARLGPEQADPVSRDVAWPEAAPTWVPPSPKQ
jgi:hypothetical protein